MAIDVTLCNRCLSIVGTRSTIASPTENSVEAIQCGIHYDAVLLALLRLHTWSFARKQISGAMISAAQGTPANPTGVPPIPLFPWLYEYAWPQDCVRMRRVEVPPAQPASDFATLSWVGGYPPLNQGATGMFGGGGAHPTPPFVISTDLDSAGNTIKVLLTNQDQAIFVYTADIEDPNMWDPEFTEAFVYTLAARLCGPLTGTKTSPKFTCRKRNRRSFRQDLSMQLSSRQDQSIPPTGSGCGGVRPTSSAGTLWQREFIPSQNRSISQC